MHIVAAGILLTAMVHDSSGGSKVSGIDQFWTDDYKVFDQVYGKTSDKEIYGEKLPASVTFTNENKKEASEKHERYVVNYKDPDAEMYAHNLRNKQKTKIPKPYYKEVKKPAISTINYVSYSNNFKPISQESDPEMYNYLKHLEEYSKEEKHTYPKNVGGFKPYVSHIPVEEPEEGDAYKSIQEILDAHEANKGSNYRLEHDEKYWSNSKKKKPIRFYNEGSNRCTGGRCRNKVVYRSRGRPYLRSPSVKTLYVI